MRKLLPFEPVNGSNELVVDLSAIEHGDELLFSREDARRLLTLHENGYLWPWMLILVSKSRKSMRLRFLRP